LTSAITGITNKQMRSLCGEKKKQTKRGTRGKNNELTGG